MIWSNSSIVMALEYWETNLHIKYGPELEIMIHIQTLQEKQNVLDCSNQLVEIVLH